MTDKILADFEDQLESITLIPSQGGVFEIVVDGDLIYSKRQTGRHASYEEIRESLTKR
jgi:selenoprotein W-related protein